MDAGQYNQNLTSPKANSTQSCVQRLEGLSFYRGGKMKANKKKHYSLEEKRKLLNVSDLMLSHDVKKIADVCDKLPFDALARLAKIINHWAKGKPR